MLTYEDVLLYLPELTHSLKLIEPLVYDFHVYLAYHPSTMESNIIMSVCYQYSKPSGFRSINILGFYKSGEIYIINKAPVSIMERCLLWAYSIKNEPQRHKERMAIIKFELITHSLVHRLSTQS